MIHEIATIDVDLARDQVYNRVMARLTRRRVPLGFEATKLEIRAAVKGLVQGMLKVNLDTLIPDGAVKTGVHPLYMRALAAITLRFIADQETEAMEAMEAGEEIPEVVIDEDLVASQVYEKAITRLQNRRVPLSFEATRPDLQVAIQGLVEGMMNVDLLTLIPDGPVKTGMHPIYLRSLAAVTSEHIALQERPALEALEEERREFLQQAIEG